jgi:predicted acyl esterase
MPRQNLERALTQGCELSPEFDASQIRRETVWISMRDGVRLATDLYLPPHWQGAECGGSHAV